jgi:hypothetical protein
LSSTGANSIYRNVIHGLLKCSIDCFGIKNLSRNSKKKWWWDDTLRAAKRRSLNLFNVRSSEGSVIGSASHLNFCAAKDLVHKKKKVANGCLNANLYNSFKSCNSHKFWQLWRSNFSVKENYSKYKFEGLQSDHDIANYLASAHKIDCSPNSEECNAKLQNDVLLNKKLIRDANFFSPVCTTISTIEQAV